jgi:hypothetical protein
MSRYTFEVPAQLVATHRWDDLTELLTDLDFLEAKAGAGMVFELAEDFSQAVKAMPSDHPQALTLHLLEEALRADLHFYQRSKIQAWPQAIRGPGQEVQLDPHATPADSTSRGSTIGLGFA